LYSARVCDYNLLLYDRVGHFYGDRDKIVLWSTEFGNVGMLVMFYNKQFRWRGALKKFACGKPFLIRKLPLIGLSFVYFY